MHKVTQLTERIRKLERGEKFKPVDVSPYMIYSAMEELGIEEFAPPEREGNWMCDYRLRFSDGISLYHAFGSAWYGSCTIERT